MKIPPASLQRRRFLQSGSVLALGAATTVFAGRRLFGLPSGPSHGRGAEPALAHHEVPALSLPEPAPPAVSEPENETLPSPPSRPLEYEEDYAEFLTSLDLRHLSPHEIIDPHREVTDGVPNSLPPERMWEKLAPTLKAADELRERLELPLCRITSAFRAPRYNAVIPGAVPRSYHTRNQALDLVYFCSPRKAFNTALQLRREGFFRGGVGLYPTFIHLDTRGYAATWRRV